MADFLTAFKLTKGNEGNELTNDPDDLGGLTYAGIASKANPHWKGWAIIKEHNLKVGQSLPILDEEVQNFYKKNYWDTVGGLDELTDQLLANQVYDESVNGGVGSAKQLLKASLS